MPLRIVPIDMDGLAMTGLSLGETSELIKNIAEIVMCVSKIRLKLYSAPEA